jgi:DNA-binding LytR/AlgR family response regulator
MIRTLIIEDEMPAAERLEKMLKSVEPSLEVLDILDSVEGSVNWFSENDPPDLLMLDIQLADGLSFDIFKKTSIDCFVIFTTAYDEYAIKAFELNSVDYLLKPVDREKLARSIEKFKKLRDSSAQLNIQDLIETIESRSGKYKKRFAVSVGNKIISVETQKVAYFYSMEKSTFLCTADDHHYPLDFSLDHLELILDPDNFFRINRQNIINYANILKVHVLSKSRIKIETEPACRDNLLVSTAKTHKFRLWLDR